MYTKNIQKENMSKFGISNHLISRATTAPADPAMQEALVDLGALVPNPTPN